MATKTDAAPKPVTTGQMLEIILQQLTPEERAVVPISDRGLLYGDGLFETLRVRQGRPLWWDRHLDRRRCGRRHGHDIRCR